jgi:3-deoxy-D-manno-octulosonate 8-phosphate phosphatase (KDO 8-P phosphatase)
MSWSARAEKIRAVILDVDGVLTHGVVGYGPVDNVKAFNIRDGHVLRMALRAGLLVGILSGRFEPANRRRCEELQMSFIYEGQHDKGAALTRLLEEHQLTAEECLFVGDDVVDIPVMRRVGLAVAVADAVPDLLPYCHFQTSAPGGAGAVREVIEWLMRRQGRWSELMLRYR